MMRANGKEIVIPAGLHPGPMRYTRCPECGAKLSRRGRKRHFRQKKCAYKLGEERAKWRTK